MNLQTPMGSVGNAGAVAFGGPQAAPAHFQVGAVGFGPQWTMEDSMAASIVRLEQENEELRAEVALLREEQKILAKGFPSPAKAAVIEGVEQQDLPAGVSRIGCHERPEPSPHFSDTPETDEAVERWRQGKINIFDEMARLERERDNLQDQRDFAMSEIERLQYQLRNTVSQRDIAWACRQYQGGQEAVLLELGATQAAVAEVLGLTETPTTADEVRQALRGVVGLAEALAKTQIELKKERDEAERENEQLLASNKTYERDWPVLVHERDEARKLADSAMLEADRLRPQRNEAVEAICDFVNGQVWPAETWGNARHLRRLFEIAQAEGCK